MYSAGLPVPNGFCITANAFDEYMEQNNFQQQPSAYSDDLRLQIENGNIPLELEQEIAKCHVELGQNIRLAVRSSATTEDLPEASFAGQQETYLNVIGEKQLYIAIKNVLLLCIRHELSLIGNSQTLMLSRSPWRLLFRKWLKAKYQEFFLLLIQLAKIQVK